MTATVTNLNLNDENDNHLHETTASTQPSTSDLKLPHDLRLQRPGQLDGKFQMPVKWKRKEWEDHMNVESFCDGGNPINRTNTTKRQKSMYFSKSSFSNQTFWALLQKLWTLLQFFLNTDATLAQKAEWNKREGENTREISNLEILNRWLWFGRLI